MAIEKLSDSPSLVEVKKVSSYLFTPLKGFGIYHYHDVQDLEGNQYTVYNHQIQKKVEAGILRTYIHIQEREDENNKARIDH